MLAKTWNMWFNLECMCVQCCSCSLCSAWHSHQVLVGIDHIGSDIVRWDVNVVILWLSRIVWCVEEQRCNAEGWRHEMLMEICAANLCSIKMVYARWQWGLQDKAQATRWISITRIWVRERWIMFAASQPLTWLCSVYTCAACKQGRACLCPGCAVVTHVQHANKGEHDNVSCMTMRIHHWPEPAAASTRNMHTACVLRTQVCLQLSSTFTHCD